MLAVCFPPASALFGANIVRLIVQNTDVNKKKLNDLKRAECDRWRSCLRWEIVIIWFDYSATCLGVFYFLIGFSVNRGAFPNRTFTNNAARLFTWQSVHLRYRWAEDDRQGICHLGTIYVLLMVRSDYEYIPFPNAILS
jgi:hypothetical protein